MRCSGFIQHGRGSGRFPVLPLLVALVMVLPVLVVGSSLLTPSPAVWSHLWRTILPELLRNTLLLALGVGAGTFVIGTGLAWVMVAYRFPGQAILQWLVVLPMAVPAYVLGFVYTATLDTAGPVQSLLRRWPGEVAWLPEIRSGAGAIVVMTLALYPYVYLLARAGFREVSGTALETARALGHGPAALFFRIVLPLARPSIAAGVALAVMEALADFATVRHFNFPTLSDGVLRVWHGMMDLRAASELAGLLAVVALAVILLEHGLRGRSRYYQRRGKGRGITRIQLSGWQAWLAAGICCLVVAVAFVLPVGQLSYWAWQEAARMRPAAVAVYTGLALNSLVLAGLAAGLTTMMALFLAGLGRLHGRGVARSLLRPVTTGYAMPGAVMAVGVLMVVSALDQAINHVWEAWRGAAAGLMFTGSLAGLLYAYMARFMAVTYASVDASMEKISPSLVEAARMMGVSHWRIMWQVYLPLVMRGMLAGATLVFVDVMKELPLTVILRPFGYDTLAIWVWQMATESLWAGASLPALAIVLVGLLPVVLLTGARAAD